MGFIIKKLKVVQCMIYYLYFIYYLYLNKPFISAYKIIIELIINPKIQGRVINRILGTKIHYKIYSLPYSQLYIKTLTVVQIL